MEAVLSTLGLGTRYCVVSDDHDQPEEYADEHERCPQTALERFTDLHGVYDKFSRAGPAGRQAGRSAAPPVCRQRPGDAPRPSGSWTAGETFLALCDRLATRPSRAQLASFDRQYPLRSEKTDSRQNDGPDSGLSVSRNFCHRWPESSAELTSARDAPTSEVTSTGDVSRGRDVSSPRPGPAGGHAQDVLIDLSDN